MVIEPVSTDISMVATSTEDSARRKTYTEQLKADLVALDGVERVTGGGFDHQNYQTARLEIEVETNGAPNWARGVYLDVDPRSISPRLRNTVGDADGVSTYRVSRTPTALDAAKDHYDGNVYIIEVWYP